MGPRQAAFPARAGCELVSGSGVSVTTAQAREAAQAALLREAETLHAFLRREGARSIRAGDPKFSCGGYPLGVGLIQCIGQAQVCTR